MRHKGNRGIAFNLTSCVIYFFVAIITPFPLVAILAFCASIGMFLGVVHDFKFNRKHYPLRQRSEISLNKLIRVIELIGVEPLGDRLYSNDKIGQKIIDKVNKYTKVKNEIEELVESNKMK
jgi:hypothetical protein